MPTKHHPRKLRKRPCRVCRKWIEKTFCLARPCTGGNQGGAGIRPAQPLEGLLLVAVGMKRQGQVWKIVCISPARLEGQLHVEIRALEHFSRLFKKLVKDGGKTRGGNRKSGAKEILHTLLDVPGKNRRNHGEVRNE